MDKSATRKSSRVLIEAIKRKSSKEVEHLLIQGSNSNCLDYEGDSALHHAVRSRDENIVELLLKYGATEDVFATDGLMPFNIAAKHKDFSCLEVLLKHRTSGSVSVFNKSLGTYPKKILDVICGCVDVNGKDELGYTALYWAVYWDNLYAVQKLLLREANVNITTSYEEYTPLHVVRSSKCVDILLQNGAELNRRDKFGYTPLSTIVLGHNFSFTKRDIERREEARIIETLILSGADGVDVIHSGQIFLDYGKSLESMHGFRDLLRYMALRQKECQYISKTDLRLNDNSCELGQYYSKCLSEVDKLKVEFVFDNITYYEFITKNTKNMSEKIFDFRACELFKINKPNYTSLFPLYSEIIQRYFDDAMERRLLRKSACIGISVAVPCVDSQHIVTQKILELLEFDDMKNLVAACQSMLCLKDT